mgnify:CR=1 FL=1
MARKRCNGEGYIGKLNDGRWGARITCGYNSKGKQAFKYFSAKTQQGVSEKLSKYIESKRNGTYIEMNSWSLEKWLDYWYLNHSVGKTRTSTRVNDESIINHHLNPRLGKIKLQELKGVQIQQVYNQLLENGRVDKRGGLSPKTIKNVHVVLHRALEQAVKDELIIKNPLNSVTLPRMNKVSIEILSPDEQKRLQEVCTPEHPWNMAILLTLYSGVRMGELLGLTWDVVSFEKNNIRINKQVNRLKNYDKDAKSKTKLALRNETKTEHSERTIMIAPVIMQKLKEYKESQEAYGKGIGKDFNKHNLVFSRYDGDLVDPATFRDHYLRTLKKANISPKSFHALRHTFATRALETNVNIKVVSEILGHATIQITLDTYSHVSLDQQEDAMQRIADNFFII